MLSKIYLIFFFLLVIGGSAYYFSTNPSYQNSLQARIYYFLGNYENAYNLAKEAYEDDQYNKMAFTVMTQSKIAKNYESYIKQGNEFFARIDAISAKEEYTKADKNRVKMMCEIMTESYKQLVPTTLTDDLLQENAKKMYMKFTQLYEELF